MNKVSRLVVALPGIFFVVTGLTHVASFKPGMIAVELVITGLLLARTLPVPRLHHWPITNSM